MVRQAIQRELRRQDKTTYWLWKKSGVPRTVVYEFIAGTRDVELRHAEAMLKALGLVVAATTKKGR